MGAWRPETWSLRVSGAAGGLARRARGPRAPPLGAARRWNRPRPGCCRPGATCGRSSGPPWRRLRTRAIPCSGAPWRLPAGRHGRSGPRLWPPRQRRRAGAPRPSGGYGRRVQRWQSCSSACALSKRTAALGRRRCKRSLRRRAPRTLSKLPGCGSSRVPFRAAGTS